MTVQTSGPILGQYHGAEELLPRGGASSVELLTTFEQIASVREEWQTWTCFPETDPDFVRIIIQSRPEAKAPCVMVLRQTGVVQALLIGRIEICRLNSLPTGAAAIQPHLKVLRVLYEGLLGDWTEQNIDTCLREIKQGLSRGDWHAVHFHMLNLRSPWWTRAEKMFPRYCRGSIAPPNAHWTAKLPKSYRDYFQSLDSRVRKNLNRHRKRLESEFSDLLVKRFDQISDLEAIVNTSEAIIAKTYQQGFTTGWSSEEMKRRVALWLGKGQFHAFFLYVNGQPCAYEHILKYRGGAYGMGTAYDPAFRSFSVGRYIQMKALEEIWKDENDITRLDFGFGDAEYKRELCQICEQEADMVLFGSRPVSIWGNAMRTLEIRGVQLIKHALKSTGMFSAIKSRWREYRRKTAERKKRATRPNE
jgi:CelD/BcsL family acetyltransferase involved in cellulose biosynthesis